MYKRVKHSTHLIIVERSNVLNVRNSGLRKYVSSDLDCDTASGAFDEVDDLLPRFVVDIDAVDLDQSVARQ